MKNYLQSTTLKEELEALHKKQQKELQDTNGKGFFSKIKSIIKIKIKYHKLKQELWNKNYSNRLYQDYKYSKSH